ncbi:MAG: helix-hairpin-helix domain-containing protein [Bacteroidetes bacterium]|nr:helix-hairpin-helix domain-containing protein [Bacteroidota bacterium]
MLKKISRKIGFTETEIKVILFLAVGFLIGFGIKIYNDNSKPEYKSYDYSKEDSLFNYYNSRSEKNLNDKKNSKEDKIVDSKEEVLDFSSRNFYKKKSLLPPEEKSINLNEADLETLIRLPGIGQITAKKIIDLRSKKTKFENLEELMEVKGIGAVKFNKIKKFLYIK